MCGFGKNTLFFCLTRLVIRVAVKVSAAALHLGIISIDFCTFSYGACLYYKLKLKKKTLILCYNNECYHACQ